MEDLVYEGIDVALYVSSFREEKRDNNYTLLVRKDNGFPVVLRFVGYDRLFGSHYDEYIILYSSFVPNVDSSVFDIEKSKGRKFFLIFYIFLFIIRCSSSTSGKHLCVNLLNCGFCAP